MKTFLFLAPFLLLFLKGLQGQTKGERATLEPTPPTVVFSAMLWGEEGTEIFSYAPWDNHEDGNATTLEIPVASGIVSQKYAYYGKGPLRLLATEDNPDGEFEQESNSSAERIQWEVAASCNFKIVSGQTKEYILLIAPKKRTEKGSKTRIYPVPFDQGRIPAGSFSFSSQARNTLYIEFGQKKFSIAPKNPVVQKAQTEENARIIPLKIYLRKSGKYELALSREWPHANRLRGLFYLTETPSGVEVTRIADFPQDVDQAIGYGIGPRITQSEDQEKAAQ